MFNSSFSKLLSKYSFDKLFSKREIALMGGKYFALSGTLKLTSSNFSDTLQAGILELPKLVHLYNQQVLVKLLQVSLIHL
jgi:hypothetical protein